MLQYFVIIFSSVISVFILLILFVRLLTVDKHLKLKKFHSKQKGFSDLFNYAYLIEDGVIVGKNGSLMVAWEYRGIDHESCLDEEKERLSNIINKAISPLGNGWMMHIDAVRDNIKSYYPETNSFFPDLVSLKIDQERRDFFEKEGNLYDERFVLTLTWFPPVLTQRKFVEIMFSEDKILKGKNTETEKILQEFSRNINNIENQLSNTLKMRRLKMKKVFSMDEKSKTFEEFLSWLQFCLTGISQEICLPKNPIYLDALIGGQELRTGIIPKIGRKYIQTISIEGFPFESYPGILSSLSKLPIKYRWSSRFIFLAQHEAIEHFKKFRKKWKQKVRGFFDQVFHTNSGPINQDALLMVEDAEASISDIEGGLGYGYYTSVIVLMDEDRNILEKNAKEIEKVIQRLGFVARSETINNLEAYLGSLPGHGVENIRRPLINTLNLADFLPSDSIWPGESFAPCNLYQETAPPVMKCITYGDSCFHLNLHVRDVGHTFMFGPTGAGKSTHLAIIAAQLLRYKNMSIFAFDKGMSLYPLTKSVKGDHFELASDFSKLSFCPLQYLETNSDVAWSIQWIESILLLNNVEVSPEIHDSIENAIVQMKKTDAKTMTNFYNKVQNQKVKEVIKQYTINSSTGYLLDSDHDNLSFSNFTTFEIEELMNLPQKYSLPVLLYLFRRIEKTLNGQPAAIILDEAWLMLSHSVFREKIREWLKVLRKANCLVLMATQSLSDAMNSEIFDVIIESTATKIFLPNLQAQNEDIKIRYKRMGLNEKQINIIAHAIPKKQYYYVSEKGARLYELCLGKFSLAFVGSSDKDSINKIKKLKQKHGDKWIKEWLKEKNYHN